MAPTACGTPIRYSALWPHRELRRRHQWNRPHAPPPHSTALCGPIGSSTESPSGAARMRHPHQ
eukprot:2349720-Pyramimonas_sp.AAC.1